MKTTPKEFRVTIREGRKWVHVRYEAMQDNAPRYNVRTFRLDKNHPEWQVEVGGILSGFIGWDPDAP